MKKRIENFFIEKDNGLVNYKIIHVYSAEDIYEAEHEYANEELLFADMEKHNVNKRFRMLQKANKLSHSSIRKSKEVRIARKKSMNFEAEIPF